MSGHSKWANIKHKKARMDAQKGKVYTKFSKMLILAAREGGPDPNTNFKLKDIIDKAKESNMPNDNIIRAIKRGSGELGGDDYEELMYEGYGPGGVAVLVEAMTDNRNRIASELRHIFDKHGGNLGETGCVAWMFEKKGLIIVEKNEDMDSDDVMMLAIDAGAGDVEEQEDAIEITTSLEQFEAVKKALENNKIKLATDEITYIPNTYINLTDKDKEKMELLLEILEEHDDIQNVYCNYESDDVD